MKRRKIKRRKNTGAPKWMVTYSDMITLILVFFILLFSMSRIDSIKFQAVSDSFRNRAIFDFQPSAVPVEYPAPNHGELTKGKSPNDYDLPTKQSEQSDENEEDALNKLVKDVEGYLDENDLHNVITANRTDRGVVLVLQEQILFETGEADILHSGKPFLNKVGSLLKNIPNHVKVEGHSDNRPISTFRYPSNWELSGARASSVVRYLIEEFHFDKSRFSLAGYGDTRPRVQNDSPKNWEKNRRVEIVVLEHGDKEE
ncbi:flagellar motor protein MotB [Cerasibacillus terrae]|uniref:Flagellar motor protein MotB n=1 Tax=Cerasibacillus terrae TaxID=2498845 RepID=A0A5C8NJE6_9BACI|nr:flagellar motor protein MotS [Cerasibacillus terrae]TXL60553.1 flagellar motor protein MotB [Cerasibacillus terrae]